MPRMAGPWQLQRFVDAQAPVFDAVLAELAAGAKRSHWMWFVFPQLAGLGRSSTARHYGLAGLDEARAYAAHPLLGPRLVACCRLLQMHTARPPDAVLGAVDALKLRSSLTLFERAAPHEPLFAELLERLYGGQRCEPTIALLGGAAAA
jgi:uncharacterized protein (DUF1810 family)